jgi:Flp pilus assembly protein TadG
MKSLQQIWLRTRFSAAGLMEDCRGIAATEFALILPVMLVLFFGTVEFSAGVAVDRKVTLMARTLADLTSQTLSVANSDLTNFFNASNAIMTPYSGTPTQATVSELYVDPSTLQARVEWSQGAVPRAIKSPVTIPTALAVGGTYLIFSEVTYVYVPVVDYKMANVGITLHDVAYTRPRQSQCVFYPTTSPPPTSCPTS